MHGPRFLYRNGKAAVVWVLHNLLHWRAALWAFASPQRGCVHFRAHIKPPAGQTHTKKSMLLKTLLLRHSPPWQPVGKAPNGKARYVGCWSSHCHLPLLKNGLNHGFLFHKTRVVCSVYHFLMSCQHYKSEAFGPWKSRFLVFWGSLWDVAALHLPWEKDARGSRPALGDIQVLPPLGRVISRGPALNSPVAWHSCSGPHAGGVIFVQQSFCNFMYFL